MNVDSILGGVYVRQLRLYLLAILVYVGIAALIVVPKIQTAHADQAVKLQLSQYLQQAKTAKTPSPTITSVSGVPASIAISRLGISLPVAPGYYNLNTRKWTLDSKHVFTNNYTDPNPVVGGHQPRVTVFYGHDIPGVLINTSKLVYGDIMTVNTQNGYQFRYYYDRSKVIVPSDTSILNEANVGDPIMLVTCTGTWYQFRHVMYFHLLDIHKLPAGQGRSKGFVT